MLECFSIFGASRQVLQLSKGDSVIIEFKHTIGQFCFQVVWLCTSFVTSFVINKTEIISKSQLTGFKDY